MDKLQQLVCFQSTFGAPTAIRGGLSPDMQQKRLWIFVCRKIDKPIIILYHLVRTLLPAQVRDKERQRGDDGTVWVCRGGTRLANAQRHHKHATTWIVLYHATCWQGDFVRRLFVVTEYSIRWTT